MNDMANQEAIMTAKLFLNAAFPVLQVLMDEDPKLHDKAQKFNHTIAFGVKGDDEGLWCHMIFKNGHLDVVQGKTDKADVTMTFATVEKMNALLKGTSMALPAIRGSLFVGLDFLLNYLMGLKIMTKTPTNDQEKYLKVKCSLYLICRAMSTYNKLGDPDFHEFCQRQPDRIYQFRVEDGDDPAKIACYLRVCQGKSKSGHGIYEKRTPFVLFRFTSVDGALQILNKEKAFVAGAEEGLVETVGSPEYACYLNDYMAIIQAMVT
jgi:hypothetical protein